ncbi:MAG: shikimate 5-dehydrogenase [Clostridia bacterium]|nr:shikimate 5-dehydrogenase [Clostridia bacterium]
MELKGKYFVTGRSLPHTMSPDIYIRLGLNYGVKEFATEEEFIAWVQKGDYDGFNVTIPYKQTIIPCLDVISPEAEEIGAVNTVVKKDGKLYGYNTDCYGLARSLIERGIELKDKNVAILGTGGTSKCAYYVCKKAGAKSINVCSRKGGYSYADLYADNTADVIINTTPVGMFPNINDQVVELKKLSNVKAVYDVVYNPLTTSLIGEAKSLGLKCGNGLNMLIWQGIKAYELYTDSIVEDKVAQNILNEIYNEKKNLVLIGMPGSGKSTYGKLIAKELNKEFYDTDKVFEETFGSTPKQVILEKGEPAFRDMESEIVATLSSKLGVVIATGGGAVLRENNRKLLKANGTVLFIDRDISLLPTDGRPLSKEYGVQKLYEEREPIYRETADITIKTDATTIIKEAVKDIIELLK